jgi:hypothetical protein
MLPETIHELDFDFIKNTFVIHISFLQHGHGENVILG